MARTTVDFNARLPAANATSSVTHSLLSRPEMPVTQQGAREGLGVGARGRGKGGGVGAWGKGRRRGRGR